MTKNKLAFTLAEVLIVIGIIGVVAALTLPNLNHATGDKETVTRLQKAYSILNEANDRAVAIYGPISTWKSNEQCSSNLNVCWMKRIGEFLKISKSCNENGSEEDGSYSSCESLVQGDMNYDGIIHQLSDGTSFAANGSYDDCADNIGSIDSWRYVNDVCFDEIHIDINGPTKGKNLSGHDIFRFIISESSGVLPLKDDNTLESETSTCMTFKDAFECTWWVLEYGNLDYLKADSEGKCNDSNIILDGVTNTSCH